MQMSLVVPVYDLGSYFQPMLATLAQQTADFELWLVDDHSQDGSAAVAAEFVLGHPDWHVLRLPHHAGISAARNAGLARANGEAIAFVDGDDLLAPDFVATLAAGFAQSEVIGTSVGYRWWHSGPVTKTPWQYLDQPTMFDQVSHHGTEIGGYVWNKAFLRQAIGDLRFDETLRLAEDYWFTASFVARNPGIYAHAPQVRYTKVSRPHSTIHSAGFAARRQEDEVFERIRKLERQLH
ncbi:glycosyltransferase family 2 protein [Lacticaseibacillus baoqingensis]|uniref:Glycosyltransferase family 2 protein n=1 Tax=Lacticaseibacillus baoqingensis TaxID=2486013 RepID=A0ABW4E474_9LACO